MIIQSKEFGELTVDENDLITLRDGIYGFEDIKQYAILTDEENEFVLWMHPVNKPEMNSFLVFTSNAVYDNYAPIIAKEDLDSLGVLQADDLVFLLIAVLNSDPKKISVNLKSPVAVNPDTKISKQIIVENKDYPIRYFPFTD